MAAARVHFNLTSTAVPSVVAQTQSWRHSPVPYLFGGLAAMLGLIAFALLILACSYWRLSGHFSGRDGGRTSSGERDLEAGEGVKVEELKVKESVFEDKVLVIMAGEKEPRYLATPMSSSRSSSFGDSSSSSSFSSGDDKSGKLEMVSEDLNQARSLQPENDDHEDPNHRDDAPGHTMDGVGSRDRGE